MRIERLLRALCFWPLVSLTGCSDDGEGDKCELEDADGIIGGKYTFALLVNDQSFEPIVFAGQNTADVTLTLTNQGTGASGFSIDCLPTPNSDGCPTQSCFPDSHVVEPIAPGASATVEFKIPEVEGIYTFRALRNDDARVGQFIVQ